MRYERKVFLPIFMLCTFLTACGQPFAVETEVTSPIPAETPSPTPTPAPLTLAGVELNSAVMLDFTDEKEGHPYRMGQEAELDKAFHDWGFSPDSPFYEYHSEEGADVTLYYDEVQDRGLGIFGGGYGFGFDRSFPAEEGRWDDWSKDPMSPPERNYPEDWTDFREEKEYDEMGRLTCLNVYANTGDTRFDDPANCWLYRVDYSYDEAGTLRYKDFWSNPSFGNYAQADEFWYDAQGRLVYAEGYITHGRLYYYYIYAEDDLTPAYLLHIDRNVGYSDPTLIRY